MKILVIDCNIRYLNPVRNLLPYHLSLIGDVEFYGPGYCSSEIIRSGLSKFIEKRGPFDATIRTVHAIPSKLIDAIVRPFHSDKLKAYRTDYNYTFPDRDLSAFWADASRNEITSDFNVALLHQYDFQVMSADFSGYLAENFNLIVGLNIDFWRPISSLPKELLGNFGRINDNWYDLIRTYPEKIVGLMNFVSGEEFDYSPIDGRRSTWSVLGTSYASRKNAKNMLKSSAIDCDDGRTFRIQFLKFKKMIGFRPFSKRKNLDVFREDFFSAMRNSKFSYTCGSTLRVPIRKFLEIPASGALLVCEPCNGFDKLGFRDQKNAIVCHPEELPELSQRLTADLDHAQEMASAGQKMVLEKHTVHARSHQLRKAIELGVKGDYHGSFWQDGELIWLKKDSCD